MAQAKTLTKVELKRLFDVTRSCSRYAERDLTMLQLTHYCGMRVGEVANLLVGDVLDADGMVSAEIVLAAHSTKSKRARRIFVPRQMQRQLQQRKAQRQMQQWTLPQGSARRWPPMKRRKQKSRIST